MCVHHPDVTFNPLVVADFFFSWAHSSWPGPCAADRAAYSIIRPSESPSQTTRLHFSLFKNKSHFIISFKNRKEKSKRLADLFSLQKNCVLFF